MIEYDYKIKRDYGIEFKTFKPALPTKLDNISYIEAPNSTGKSTLLHILAIAFYGARKSELHPALLAKMNNLLKSSYQELTFKVTLSNNDGSIKIVSEKKDPKRQDVQIREIINDKSTILDPKRLVDKYNLIYDIPADPTERLKELGREIQDEQVRYGRNLNHLRRFINSIRTDIHNSRDPEKIDKYKGDVQGFVKKSKRIKETIENLSRELDELEKAVYYKYFTMYKAICDQKKQKLDKISKNLKKGEKRKKKKIKVSDSLQDNLELELSELDDIFNSVIEVLKKLFPKGQDPHIKFLERTNILKIADCLEFDDDLSSEIERFKKLVKELESKKEGETVVKEVKLYHELLEVLKRFEDTKLIIPGVKKTISEFVSDLKKSYDEKATINAFLENLQVSNELLNDLESKIYEIENNFLNKLREMKETDKTDESDEEDNALRNYRCTEDEFAKAYKRFEIYDKKFAAIGRPLKRKILSIGSGLLEDYETYTEDQLLTSISKLKVEKNSEETELTKIERHIEFFTDEIKKLEKKEPHAYHYFLDELKELEKLVAILENKVADEFGKYIINIIEKKDSNSSKEQEKYNQAVFKYLGNKIGYIRHLDKEYEVDLIDLVEDVIVTKKKRIIHLSDMGTGQSQSAYLKGKLDISDDRKIIALFDEVAMMDNKSLGPIYNKFRELYKNDKLLVGLVVQKAEKMNVVSKIAE